MKLVCPSCGLTASAEAWINDASARDMLLAVATLPHPLPKATLPYLGLFRPEKRALSWGKAGNIVAELTKLTSNGHVQAKGKVARPCPPRIWAEAMEKMLEQRDSIQRPLPNHNYLKEVAWPLANEADAKAESQPVRRTVVQGNQINPPQSSFSKGGSMSPMNAYIQGHRDDKPTEEEMQAWHKERLS